MHRRLNAIDLLSQMNSSKIGSSLDMESLTMEIMSLIGGGTETTATSATIAVYEILRNEHVFKTLRRELDEVFKDREDIPLWHEFEKLPYLVGITNENSL